MEKRKYEDIYREFSKNPDEFILKCEKNFDSFIDKCVKIIKEKDIKRVFICGQSGSGKTTTSLRIAEALEKCHIVELDDFFLPRGKHRKNKNGEEDFETVFALDLNSIYEFGKNIRENKKVIMPDYDFKKGGKGQERELVIGSDEVLILEGIHSFNHRLINTFGIDGKNLMIFVTVNSGLEFENTLLSKNDLRFARRLVRDYHHRNANPDWTIELWHLVRAGEKRYTGGYMKKADIIFDTFLDYEIFLLKEDFEFLADLGVKTAKSKGYYKTLLSKYRKIAEVPHITVPPRSILNEFTGEKK